MDTRNREYRRKRMKWTFTSKRVYQKFTTVPNWIVSEHKEDISVGRIIYFSIIVYRIF